MQPLYLKLHQVIITKVGLCACLFTPESATFGNHYSWVINYKIDIYNRGERNTS